MAFMSLVSPVVIFGDVTINSNADGLAAYGIIFVIGLIIFAIVGLVLLPALIVAGLARREAERLRNSRLSTVIAQYDPPHGLAPAEIGLLYDMRCDKTELMATLFHLEQRHIIDIVDDKTVHVTNEAGYAGLKEFEKIAIRIANGQTDGLEAARQYPISVYDSAGNLKQTLNLSIPAKKSLGGFAVAVKSSVGDQGIKMNSYYLAFMLRVVIIALVIGLLPLAFVATPSTWNGVTYPAWSVQAFYTAITSATVLGLLFFPLYILAGFTLVFIWTKIAGRYWINTPQARALWPEIEGYKQYLQRVDLDKIQFESTDNAHNPVTDTLPYAMVFGLDTKWQERLANRPK